MIDVKKADCMDLMSVMGGGTQQVFHTDCIKFITSSLFKQVKSNHKIVIVSDPPFNIGYKYNSYSDRMNEPEYYQMLSKLIESVDGNAVIIHYPESLHRLSMEINQPPKRVVSWVYNSNTFRQHRDIAFYGINPDFGKVLQPYKNPTDKRIKKRIEEGYTGCKLYDWWNVNQTKNVSKTGDLSTHPCVMPIEVMTNIVGILPQDAIIFDPFLGSGTTAVACKLLGRNCIGCEIDEKYINVINRRLAEIEPIKKGIDSWV